MQKRMHKSSKVFCHKWMSMKYVMCVYEGAGGGVKKILPIFLFKKQGLSKNS